MSRPLLTPLRRLKPRTSFNDASSRERRVIKSTRRAAWRIGAWLDRLKGTSYPKDGVAQSTWISYAT